MTPLAPEAIRRSFVNCSQGVAKRLPLPRDLDALPWEHLDFLGWRDPGAPQAAHLLVPDPDGPLGLVLRLPSERGRGARQNMCSLCTTVHSASDVALMVAARPGAAGRQGNTVGAYLCADLSCSLYARGRRRPARVQPAETLDVDAKVARLQTNLETFVRRVTTA